jgi:hypothetical protein
MAHPNKVKGDRFEIAVREHCRSTGVDAERTRAGYEHDYGDVHLGTRPGQPPFAILQCKNEARMDLAGYVRATEAQRVAAGAEHGAAVVKRRGVGDPGQQYAVMTLDAYLRLLKAAGVASSIPEEGAA